MASGSGHFEGALDVFLPLDFTKIGRREKRGVFHFETGVRRLAGKTDLSTQDRLHLMSDLGWMGQANLITCYRNKEPWWRG